MYCSDGDETKGGKPFQTRAAATGNARNLDLPNEEHHYLKFMREKHLC